MKYRAKFEVEAMQWMGGNKDEISSWVGRDAKITVDRDGDLWVGSMSIAKQTCWILREPFDPTPCKRPIHKYSIMGDAEFKARFETGV
jgi:hypothetical protein